MWPRTCHVQRDDTKGQGLIEFALALPVLILMLLGLIELGMLMRAHLVLVNANREAGRFSGRGVFTDEQIAERNLVAISGQLPATTVGPEANTTIIVTRFHIPADPAQTATYYAPVYITGTLTHTSRIDPETYKVVLKDQNDQFNDELVAKQKDAQRVANDVIVVEAYYYHKQLLHAPVVEWIFPEPMVLYAWTTMRVGASRVH